MVEAKRLRRAQTRTKTARKPRRTAELRLVGDFSYKVLPFSFLPTPDQKLLSRRFSLAEASFQELEAILKLPLSTLLRSAIAVSCTNFLIAVCMANRFPKIERYLHLLQKHSETTLRALDDLVDAISAPKSPPNSAGALAKIHFDRIVGSRFEEELRALECLKRGLQDLAFELHRLGATGGPGRPGDYQLDSLLTNLYRIAGASGAKLTTISHNDRYSGKTTVLLSFVARVLELLRSQGPRFIKECGLIEAEESQSLKLLERLTKKDVGNLNGPLEKVRLAERRNLGK